MPFVFLFSESAGRALVSVPRGHEKAFTALCAERGVPWEFIGVTDPAASALEVHGQFRIGLDELREAHTGTLPRLFGGAEAARVEVAATRTGTTTVLPATAEQPVGVDPAEVVSEPIAEAGTDDSSAGAPAPVATDSAPAASEADSGVPAAAEPAAEARDETAPAADPNPAQDGSDGPAPGEPAPDQR